ALRHEGLRHQLALALPELALAREQALPDRALEHHDVLVPQHDARVLDQDRLDVVGVADQEEGLAEDLHLDDIAVGVRQIAQPPELITQEAEEVARSIGARGPRSVSSCRHRFFSFARSTLISAPTPGAAWNAASASPTARAFALSKKYTGR